MTNIISIKFSKKNYTLKKTREWFKTHHITKYKKNKTTKLYYRFSIDDKYLGGNFTNFINNVARHFKGVVMAIKGTRTNFKPSVREILKNDGDTKIINIRVCRSPVKYGISGAVKIINSLEGKPPKFDVLFHLYLIIELDNKKVYMVEKNEDINIKLFTPKEKSECIDIDTPNNLTMNSIFNNTLNKIGNERFFHYDAFSNNCQQFVKDVLISNDISLNNNQINFIMQDVKDIVPNWAQNATRFITDLANRGKIIIQGQGYKRKGKGGRILPISDLNKFLLNNTLYVVR